MTTQGATPSSAPVSVMFSPRRLIVSTLVGLLVLMGLAALIGYYFREPLMRISRMFVESFGGPGVAFGFFLPDAFTIPLPNDVATVLGLAGGMSFFEVSAWATGGSLIGGSVGYWIGRFLRRTRVVQGVLERGDGAAQKTLTRYGAWAVAVAAITPLPYSIFCWAAGAGRIPFQIFLLASTLRVVRVTGYLYLIQLGLPTTLFT